MGPVRNREFSRRDFVAGGLSLGAASLLALPGRAAAEPLPETTRLRIHENPLTCLAPQIVAQEAAACRGIQRRADT